MSEFIYVLENNSMPGLIKIGRTDRSVSERVSELSSHTGVPTEFNVARQFAVANSLDWEKKIHERFSDYRIAGNREFFKIEAEDAIAIIEEMLAIAEHRPKRDFDREDTLIARAIPIVVREGMARPRMLEEVLGISYEESLFIIQNLRGRGVIDERNQANWKFKSKPPILEPKQQRITNAEPRFVVCHCELCRGKIEYDLNELDDRENITVPCPHCGYDTALTNTI